MTIKLKRGIADVYGTAKKAYRLGLQKKIKIFAVYE